MEKYYINGKRHNENGPAVVEDNGTKRWFWYDLLHRLDGPAIEFPNGMRIWALYGDIVNEQIIGKINGLYPNPGGWFIFNGERYKILRAEISNLKGKSGQVLSQNLDIGCGNSSIKILEIQRQGRRAQKSKEFLLGNSIIKGSNLN